MAVCCMNNKHGGSMPCTSCARSSKPVDFKLACQLPEDRSIRTPLDRDSTGQWHGTALQSSIQCAIFIQDAAADRSSFLTKGAAAARCSYTYRAFTRVTLAVAGTSIGVVSWMVQCRPQRLVGEKRFNSEASRPRERQSRKGSQ
jgi:hypothetical protein